jgi:hypothetical protein
MLARHPEVGFMSNLEDRLPMPKALGRWNNELYRMVPPTFTKKGRIRFAPTEGYRVFDREVSPVLSVPERDLRAEDVTPWLEKRLRHSFEDRAHIQSKQLFLHKFTGWPRAGFLGRVFPKARFINVIRDGRAVANSFLQMPWWQGYAGPTGWGWGALPEDYLAEWEGSNRSFAVLAAIQWKLLMDAFELARAQIPPERWMDVRYEDFVAAPRSVMADTLSFLELDWTPEFEVGFSRYGLSSGRTQAYRTDLGIHEVAMLDACLSEHLERYGYLPRSADERRGRSRPARGEEDI